MVPTGKAFPGVGVPAATSASAGPGATLLCVVEGFATGATVHQATGHPVAVAFGAGNLMAVSKAMHAKRPHIPLILCADDDYRIDGNPGITKATEAARAVGGLLAVPDFGAERPDGATDFNDLAQQRGADAVRRAVANASAPVVGASPVATPDAAAGDSASYEWPEPQSLVLAEDVAAYPIDALPVGIREAVAEVLAFVQCPPVLAACSALSTLSLAGQGLADVQRAENLEGPVSLYLLAVAESGERKTTCDGHFLRPIREWERDQMEAARPHIARHAAIIAAWEARKDGIKTRIRDASKKGKNCDAITHELELVEAERPAPYRVPRLIHADATPEALAWGLAMAWPSGGVMSSEGALCSAGTA